MKYALLSLVALAAVDLASVGCSSTPDAKFSDAQNVTQKPGQIVDDRTMCDWKGRKDREIQEVAGVGSIRPNVRRVYAILGQGADKQRVLVCREADTNGDGIKDVVRKYNDKGEALFEEADTNYDGRIDTWLTFSKGHLAEAKYDTNYDGNPDQWNFYTDGKLSRVKRSTHFDGKVDRWEIYGAGERLERIGVDLDGDEKVDRWDYDTDIRKSKDETARKEDEAAAAKAEKENSQNSYNTADPSNMGSENGAGTDKDKKDDKGKKDEKGKKPKPGDKPPVAPPPPPNGGTGTGQASPKP